MTWKEGQASLETFIRFVEQSAHYNSSEVMSFHIAYNNFLKKKANSCKQADIRELFARDQKGVLLLPFLHLMSLARWRTTQALRLAVQECPAHCPSVILKIVIRIEKKKEREKKSVV